MQRLDIYCPDQGVEIENKDHLKLETDAELDALLPAVLDKAFKGIMNAP